MPAVTPRQRRVRAALYARCSTSDQHLDAQLGPLRDYAARRGLEAVEFADRGVSGAKDRRPGLDALMAAARRRELDLVICQRLDRVARSMRHLVVLAGELEALGVDLVATEQGLDTSTPTGRLTFHVLGALAEFERGLIVERTRAGLAAARRRGRRLGRPPALDARALARARRLRASGRSLREIAEVLGASKSAVARALGARA